MENLEKFSGPDQTVIRNVVKFLRAEQGAVSANVSLPSGQAVVVHRSGEVNTEFCEARSLRTPANDLGVTPGETGFQAQG